MKSLAEMFGFLQGLPPFFTAEDGWEMHQFGGWKHRKELSGALEPPHPDVVKGHSGLDAFGKLQVGFLAQLQIVMFKALSKAELRQMKEAGERSENVPEPLRGKVNKAHHTAWTCSYDLAELFGGVPRGNHNSRRAHFMMSRPELAADDNQVQAYCRMLATMPPEAYEAIEALCAD